MKKKIGIWMLALILAMSAGCGKREGGSREETEGIVLTVSLPEAEWNEYAEKLTQLYLQSHPEIERIDWNLVDRSMYSDLLKVNLASQNMPDIISTGGETSIETWRDHLVALDENALKDKLPGRYLASGKIGDILYSVPVIIEGKGILYNTEILRQQGADRIPQTRGELEALCRELDEAEIKPIMNHYKESLLTMTSYLFLLPMESGNNPGSWYALADFLDLTLEYGNRNSLTTGGDTARDYFFIERYAMLNNEGTWIAPVIRGSAAGMEEKTAVGPIPLYEEAERNKLPIQTLSLSVTKSSPYQKEAEEFLVWLATSEEAREFLEGTMGCLTVSGMKEKSLDGLSPIAAEVKEAIFAGRTVCDSSGSLPEEERIKTAEQWSHYLTGELDRDAVVESVCSLWNDYIGQQQGGN